MLFHLNAPGHRVQAALKNLLKCNEIESVGTVEYSCLQLSTQITVFLWITPWVLNCNTEFSITVYKYVQTLLVCPLPGSYCLAGFTKERLRHFFITCKKDLRELNLPSNAFFLIFFQHKGLIIHIQTITCLCSVHGFSVGDITIWAFLERN